MLLKRFRGINLLGIKIVGFADLFRQPLSIPAEILFRQPADGWIPGDFSNDHLPDNLVCQRPADGVFQNRHTGIQAQFGEMRADQFKAEGVDGGDVRPLQEEQLLPEPLIVRFGRQFFLQRLAQPEPHLGGRGVGEGHDQQLVHTYAFLRHQLHAALDQGGGFAGAGSRGKQHPTGGVDG